MQNAEWLAPLVFLLLLFAWNQPVKRLVRWRIVCAFWDGWAVIGGWMWADLGWMWGYFGMDVGLLGDD